MSLPHKDALYQVSVWNVVFLQTVPWYDLLVIIHRMSRTSSLLACWLCYLQRYRQETRGCPWHIYAKSRVRVSAKITWIWCVLVQHQFTVLLFSVGVRCFESLPEPLWDILLLKLLDAGSMDNCTRRWKCFDAGCFTTKADVVQQSWQVRMVCTPPTWLPTEC